MTYHTKTKHPGPMVLAAAMELLRVHGVPLSAAYLFETGVELEVALELLTHSTQPDLPLLRPRRATQKWYPP